MQYLIIKLNIFNIFLNINFSLIYINIIISLNNKILYYVYNF